MNLSRIFIVRPAMTTVVIAMLVFFGWYAYRSLPVNELPNVDFPTLSVSVGLLGANPEQMASSVATPLEQQFATIADLSEMSSVSTTGHTQITLQFGLDRDIDAAAQDVLTAISQAAPNLPQSLDIPPTVKKVNPADSPILYLALTSRSMPLYQLDEYAETWIAQRISSLPGVAQVQVFGGQKYAVRLFINPEQLSQRNLSLDQVASAVQRSNSNIPTGQIPGRDRTLTVRADGQLSRAADYNNMMVASSNGTFVRLADVGHAEDSVENDLVHSWINGERSIILAVQRQPGSNTVQIANRIRALLPTIRQQLPAGVHVTTVYDRSQFINESINDVKFTLLLAVFLVVAVILVFLRNLSSTLITALILPTALIATFAVMYLFHYSLNNLSLMALTLAVGFVVDDAIVVLENITRHMEMGKETMQAALDGTREIGFTILSITLSLAAVFIPILFMGGILGRLFHEFAVTVGAAVLLSGFISLSMTPMLASRFMRASGEHGRVYNFFERRFDAMRDVYRDSLCWSMRHRGLMLLVSAVLLVATGYLYLKTPKGFIPRQDASEIVGSTRAPEGTSFATMIARQQALAEIIGRNPNVATYSSTVGQGLGGITSTSLGRIFIHLKPKSERKASADEVLQQLRRQVQGVAGIQLFLQNPPAINIGGAQSSGELKFILQSMDLPTLYHAAATLEQRLRRLPSIQDVDTDLQLRNPEVQVHILRDQAAALGVASQDILSAFGNAFGGRKVSTIYGTTNQYAVMMELAYPYQQDINALGRIYVHSSNGNLVHLSQVAQIGTGVGPIAVSHYGQLPSVTLSFNAAPGHSVGEAVASVQKTAAQVLPAGVTTTFSGSAKTFQESMHTLPILLAITILVIYAILTILYEHFGHPVTILTSLPLAGFGGLAMLLLFHDELNIFSFVGIILLVGLVKKNGIMMVDFALSMERERHLAPTEAVVEACLVRFRPIMMTTVAAILATLPIALGFGAGAETRRPLGIAVVGGLLFSQFMTLFITPTFYVSMERLVSWRKRRVAAGKAAHATEANPLPSGE